MMHVLNCFAEDRGGGALLRSRSVARCLRKRGIETTFLFPAGHDQFEEVLREDGFSVIRPEVPRLRPPKNVAANARYAISFPRSVRRLKHLIDGINPDVLHTNMSLNFQAAFAGRFSDVPMIWHLNDINAPWPLSRFVARAADRVSDTVIVSSDYVDDYYYDRCAVDTETVYPPVDTEVFDPSTTVADSRLRSELSIDPSVPLVGTVGNINPAKGYRWFLESIPDVIETHGEIAVPIVGAILETQQDYYRSLLNLRTDLGLEDTVHFLGRRSDIPRIMAEFDVFVMPSVAETGPMTLMEAMAMEKPIVTTDVGVVPEQFVDGTHGLVVQPKDADQMGRAIIKLLSSKEQWATLGSNARTRAVNAFSLESIVERHETVYRSVVSRHA